MKVPAFHSSEPGREVYHDRSECTEGNNIERKYKKSGTAGRRKCHRCATLAK